MIWLPLSSTQRRIRRRRIGVLSVLSASAYIALAAAEWGGQTPWLIYNASASVPLGFYRLTPTDTVQRGDLVLMTTPPRVRDMADRRHYLPASVPMIKQVLAVSGDEVCAQDDQILLNGQPIAERQTYDTSGRPMPRWTGCHRLRSGEFFPLNPAAPRSFDGRYFGVVSTALVIGKLVPL